MRRTLTRVINALRMELSLPRSEPSVSTLARGFIKPNGDVALKVTDDGYRDENGKNPFQNRHPVVLIDNENFITLTNEQSGALVKPMGLGITGNVYLPADPEDGVYFTISTIAVGVIGINTQGQSVLGYDGETGSGDTTLTTGSVTLVYEKNPVTLRQVWHVVHVNGTYTVNDGV